MMYINKVDCRRSYEKKIKKENKEYSTEIFKEDSRIK